MSDSKGELNSVSQAFSYSLENLGMILDWCDSNWVFYINELFDNVKPKVDKARTPGIHEETRLSSDVRRATGLTEKPTEKSPGCTTITSDTSKHRVTYEDRMKKFEDRMKHLEGEDWVQKLHDFSFDELQGLQQGLEKIQEALLVLKLNKQVIRQLREHYESILNDYKIPILEGIQDECKLSFLQLFQRSKSVEANLEARQVQLEALLLLVKESKDMVSSSHFGNMEANFCSITAFYSTRPYKSTRFTPRALNYLLLRWRISRSRRNERRVQCTSLLSSLSSFFLGHSWL